MITLFGTCRLNHIQKHNQLNNLTTYTHSTKEILQLIRFFHGQVFPSPYNQLCFRTAICERVSLTNCDRYQRLFFDSDICMMEICSNKKYIHYDFYLHHLCVDKRFHPFTLHTPHEILEEYTLETQSDEEIEADILEIQACIYPKKMILVSHYNSKLNGEYIPSRNHLIQLLESISKKYCILFINPTVLLSDFTQEQVMKDDLGHYTELGIREFSKRVDFIIQTQM